MTTTSGNHDGHPDLADLEALRTGEVAGEVRRHVDACARCAEILRELEVDAAAWSAALATDESEVPEGIDRRAVEMLFAEASRIRGKTWRAGLLMRIGAAAAAILVLGIGLSILGGPEGPAADRIDPTVAASRFDVDGSGTVDIVDAYRVARRLRRGEATPDAWDVNEDGAVDAADVRTLAMAAVSLDGRR